MIVRSAIKKFSPGAGPLRSLILNAEASPEMQKGPLPKRPFASFGPAGQKGKNKHDKFT